MRQKMKKFNVSKFDMEKIHSAIPDAYDKYVNGRVSRRKFLRFAALLGMAATGAGVVFDALRAAPARQDIVRGGDFIKQPIGKGAFTMEEYAEGERIGYKARTDYWRMGADGSPLPYLVTELNGYWDRGTLDANLQQCSIKTLTSYLLLLIETLSQIAHCVDKGCWRRRTSAIRAWRARQSTQIMCLGYCCNASMDGSFI